MERGTKIKLIERLTQFSEETSVHGISYIGQSKSSPKKRLLWLVLFIGALTYMGLQIKAVVECKIHFCNSLLFGVHSYFNIKEIGLLATF